MTNALFLLISYAEYFFRTESCKKIVNISNQSEMTQPYLNVHATRPAQYAHSKLLDKLVELTLKTIQLTIYFCYKTVTDLTPGTPLPAVGRPRVRSGND